MKPTVQLAWLSLLAFAVVELAALAVTSAGVPQQAHWQAGAERLRGQLRAGDLIASAPDWTDPLLRHHLGQHMDLAMVGRADTEAFERIWSLGLAGRRPSDAPARAPDVSEAFGPLRLQRWDLGPSVVQYDFVSGLASASVHLGDHPCPHRTMPAPRGGGLGKGVLYPRKRFSCHPKRQWLFVAPVLLEDLDIKPRHCIWQHPALGRPVSVTFDDVPLGERIVLYGGLYYEHERMRKGGPVELKVLVNNRLAGTFTHRDGDGYKRLDIPTGGDRGRVVMEVTAANPNLRSFCWSATARSGPDRDSQ